MERLFYNLYAWQLTVADKLRSRRESGQGALEYVGMIAVAAILIIVVVGAIKGPTITNWINDVIRDVASVDPNDKTIPGK